MSIFSYLRCFHFTQDCLIVTELYFTWMHKQLSFKKQGQLGPGEE